MWMEQISAKPGTVVHQHFGECQGLFAVSYHPHRYVDVTAAVLQCGQSVATATEFVLISADGICVHLSP